MSAPLVTIVIPTFNGAGTLPDVLAAIARQRAPFPFETIAVDSGSSDGTLALLEDRVDRVLRIPPGSFNHGLTRNLGIESGRGELAVLLVQDAVPASDDWLRALVQPLLDDPGLAGTYARQVPRPEASAVTRHYLGKWVTTSPVPRVSALAGEDELRSLAPMERLLRCTFDNVCSCVRRSVWERHPFPATEIAEDVEWARQVLLAGHRLAYVPSAAVVHSHDRPARYELWRTYLIHRRFWQLFGLRTVPTVWHLARGVISSLVLHVQCTARDGAGVLRRPREVGRAIALAFAFPLGQYLGPRAALSRRDPLRPRGI